MRAYALALLDRVARTAIQTAAGYLAATGGKPPDWRVLGLTVALAAVVSLLQGLVDFPAIPGGWFGDVTGRALRTFAQTTAGSIGAGLLVTQVPWPTVLSASALAALASVVTSGVTTPLGALGGTPELVAGPGYVGYADRARHTRTTRHVATAVTTGVVGVCAFTAVTAAGVTAGLRTTPPPRPPAAPKAAPVPAPGADRAPGYLATLKAAGIPTTDDQQALLLVGDSVCAQRGVSTDAQQTDRIIAAVPGRWTRQQTALIIDAAVDTYC